MEARSKTNGANSKLGHATEIRILSDIGSKAIEQSSVLMSDLLSLLKHDDPLVVMQSITTGTSLFGAVLTEMALQLRNSGKVEKWLEEMWSWMLKFKDTVWNMLEPSSVGSKVLAAKFLEICVLLFTSDGKESEEGKERNFNISWIVHGHPMLNPTMLAYEADRIVTFFLDMLKSACTLSGFLVISVINSLASIAKKRPGYYDSVLSAFLDFDPNFETSRGGHALSIQYAIRIALLGFLRCTHSSMFESRDKLLRVVRLKYPGDVTEQTIRQMEKMSRVIERHSRDTRVNKDDTSAGQIFAPTDLLKTRLLTNPGDGSAVSDETPSKRARYSAAIATTQPLNVASDLQDANDAIDIFSLNAYFVSSELTPAEQMIVAIGALLAEGDKGARSLELLLSQIHADLLADIVIETMKHIPQNPSTLSGRNGCMPQNIQTSLPAISTQTATNVCSTASGQSSTLSVELALATVVSSASSTVTSDVPSVPNLVSDFKRDSRKDPRRLDPRRPAAPAGGSSIPLNSENAGYMETPLRSSSKPTCSASIKVDIAPVSLMTAIEPEPSGSSNERATGHSNSEETLEISSGTVEIDPSFEGHMPSDSVPSLVNPAEDQELTTSLDIAEDEDVDTSTLGNDQNTPSLSIKLTSEVFNYDIPALPLYVEMISEQKNALYRVAITKIIEDSKQIQASGRDQPRLPLLARLIAQTNTDKDIMTFFQKHIILDYHHNKGHDLAMYVLYHLQSVIISKLDEHPSPATDSYDTFLLAIGRMLLDSLPASDKSFSKLLGDAPVLPEPAFKLLEDLCQLRGFENHMKDDSDSDRITQGLGAVWSLIMERPLYREACLDIALKCSVHSHNDVRAKAIRLVANKLFLLPYASENIEKFARSMLLSVTDYQVSEADIKHPGSCEQITESESQETCISGSRNSEVGPAESDPMKGINSYSQNIPALSLLHVHRRTSLFFALCTKKPSLLRLVFDVYGWAAKVVKQSIHRHIPGLVRTLGPSHADLLQIISDPSEGSDNLIMLLVQLISEDSTPSADLIASVKHLYDTKLQDVTILIPMLSSLSKDEVLPIFPRLVDLPPEKFQAALARILQGSAHTGPALTPVEVLVAIHAVDPVKDRVALKKITDACTACFEQRTVFTQHVLAKSLSHMVEQVPLPMLFMRTVIQAIGTFPTLVDFVMGMLSKLVSKQIWKTPKLWVGFLKLISQTHPHSFDVLLQLPPPQLEYALNKYASLRGLLAAYADQPNIRTSLPSHILQVLGLGEPQQAPTRSLTPAASLHTSDANSIHSSTLS